MSCAVALAHAISLLTVRIGAVLGGSATGKADARQQGSTDQAFS